MISPAERFDCIQSEYHHAWFRFHPEYSVDVGVADYADRLRSYSEDDLGALIALNQKLLSALDEMPQHDLDSARSTDFRILHGAADIELHELEAQNWRYRNPAAYVPVQAIYQLLTHPVDNVHAAVKRRLDAIPQYLRGARTLLQQAPEHVVPVWLESAVEQCERGTDFMRALVRSPMISRLFSNPAKLQPVFDAAASALDEFAGFLQNDVAPRAQGDFACGRVHFERILRQKHFFACHAGTVLNLGERLLEQTREQLREQTRKMQGDEDVPALLAAIQRQHPAQNRLLDSYRDGLRNAYRWLQQADLVTLPQKQALKLQETPAFMRTRVPFAAYDPPSVIDARQQGYYYVTLPDETGLQEHNHCSIALACVHEAYPGHHLQFVLANQANAGKLTRLLNASASMYEGWALYAEQLAIEQGLLNQEEHRFMMLRDRLWRCLRIVIDVRLQTGEMSLQQAEDLLMRELGFSRSQAAAEISWYSSEPGTPLCYAVGCEMILAARQQIVDKAGASLKAFHDGLLQHGSIALPLVLQQSFGEAVWRHVHNAVFAGSGTG